jgi:molecular chaperone DnaK (HSP70)
VTTATTESTGFCDNDDGPSRFVIGIDLGTTNSAVAYVDTAQAKWAVQDFPVLQLVGPGEVEARETLPSFHYEAARGEFPAGALRLPWSEDDPQYAVGLFARDHGAAVPGRQVVSAKSWLSHSGVDRTAGLLPWHGAADVERLSPVQVSSRYLAHIRGAWDHQFPEHPMSRQDVVLTVPASFDEVARELTIQAARSAGLVKIVLVEEPQAAFYNWIYAQGPAWESRVKAGQQILVCDVGGGTSDFTLIRVRPAAGGKVLFHRVAVGEHLILGGDNLDLALAYDIEKRLTHGAKLPPRQWGPLVRACRQLKETLLGPKPPEHFTVTLAGGGSKLIGASQQVDVTRQQAQSLLLEGFLPQVRMDERPVSRRSGFQEFGLPYAPDAAITRYLAAFLTAHWRDELLRAPLPSPGTPGEGRVGASLSSAEDPLPNPPPEYRGREKGQAPLESIGGRPDLVLFNGGLFESPVLRQRLIEVLSSWFNEPGATGPWRPEVLANDRLDLAVARGAAYYGMVRRGHGVRISGGLAHSYYIGVETGRDGSALSAVCLLPAGVEEGQEVDLSGPFDKLRTSRTFELLIRQPAEFPLYVSATRTTDRPGEQLAIDPEQLTALPPIRTVLQSGRKSAADSVSVQLHAKLTELGTLEMWCSEVAGERQWRLQFDVRAATRADAARHHGAAEAQGVVDESILKAGGELIRETFRKASGGVTGSPGGLIKRLESATAMGRLQWPASLMRGLWEALMEVEDGRRISVDHEARWLNLAGFCLRPGYGLAVDDWRVAQVWRLLPGAIAFPKNELCRAEWWILWRRLAGGLSAGQQKTLAEPLVADWRTWFRKSGSNVKGRWPTFQFGPHESAEVWRLLGSMELFPDAIKREVGNMTLDRLARESAPALREALLFALGRIGGRVPVYGPLNALVSAETAAEWACRLVAVPPRAEKAAPDSQSDAGRREAFALVQLTRRTGDRYRDVDDATREAALKWLTDRNAPGHFIELVREGGQLGSEEQKFAFGESLPRGLRIE